MSMTPERIEEKKRLHEHKHPECAAHITVGEFNSLLAALEESQQQIKEWQDEAKQWRDEFVNKNDELGEAQQTIARQQERERAIKYEVSEIHKEAAAGNNGSLDRADTALNRIILLSSNLALEGNKEGTDILE